VPGESAAAGGVSFEPFGVHTGTAQFDLTLYAEDSGDRLNLMAEYDRALYDPETAERILALYRRLLVAAVEDPGARIAELLDRVGGVSFGRRLEAVSEPQGEAGTGAAPAPGGDGARRQDALAGPAGPVRAGTEAAAQKGPGAVAAARTTEQRAQTARRDRLAARRARLTPEQRAALDRRLKGAAARSGVASDAAAEAGPSGTETGGSGAGAAGSGGIRSAGPGAVAGSLVPIERPPAPGRSPTRPPLFLVHPAGGDVLCFHQLGRHLAALWSGERASERAAVYGLQSRGLVAGAAPHQTIEAMAEGYLEEIRGVQPGGPYRLAGWSLGGVVAFEMARRLVAAGNEVSFLGIFDTVPRLSDLLGDLADPERAAELLADDARWLHDMAVYVQGVWGKDLGLGYGQLRALDGDRRLEVFLAALDRAGVLPAMAPGAGVAHLRRLLDVFKTNCRAAQLYRPAVYPGRITLFRASGDGAPAGQAPPSREGTGGGTPARIGFEAAPATPSSATEDDAPALSPDAAAAMAAYAADPTLGWSAYSPRPVEVVPVPGTHVSLLGEPHVATLASRLADRLAPTPILKETP